jgi:hypothetical protein
MPGALDVFEPGEGQRLSQQPTLGPVTLQSARKPGLPALVAVAKAINPFIDQRDTVCIHEV